jgi:hypothetical protein
MLALAPKAPFIGYCRSVRGVRGRLEHRQRQEPSLPPVQPESLTATGAPCRRPSVPMPPMVQTGLIAAKQGASEDIKDATGQYNASLGQTSERAQRQGHPGPSARGGRFDVPLRRQPGRAVRYSTRQLWT